MLHLAMKNYNESITDLTKSLMYKKNDPFTLYKRGVAFYLEKCYKEALDDLLMALNYNPEPSYAPDIHYHVGLSYANLEQFEEAIDPFSEAVSLRPLEPVYFHERAKAYLLTEQYEYSVEDYDKVIELQPFNPHAFFGRAFAHKNLRNYQQAVSNISYLG